MSPIIVEIILTSVSYESITYNKNILPLLEGCGTPPCIRFYLIFRSKLSLKFKHVKSKMEKKTWSIENINETLNLYLSSHVYKNCVNLLIHSHEFLSQFGGKISAKNK